MKNIVVLIDANVLLDYIASREPFYKDAYKIIELCYSGKVTGYVAFHSVSIIWYALRKFIPDMSERRNLMKKILQAVRVTGASHEDVLKAIDMEEFKDFEDCLQDRCAESAASDYIITNNVKDFTNSVVKAITPADFCDLLKDM